MTVLHYFTLPCATNSPYGLDTTEIKADVTCRRCLVSANLPVRSKKRRPYKKAKPVKIAEAAPKMQDHFKYIRLTK